jgi:hypothetical protein
MGRLGVKGKRGGKGKMRGIFEEERKKKLRRKKQEGDGGKR